MLEYITEQDVYKTQPSVRPENKGWFDGGFQALYEGPQHAFNVMDHLFTDKKGPERPDLRERYEKNKRITEERIRDTRANPYEMGAASQFIHQLGAVATYGVMGAPIGLSAPAIGAGTGYDKYLELRDQGVDESTSTLAGMATGVTMMLGARLPPAVGNTLKTQIGTGVALNVGLGVAERGAQSKLLEGAGYDDLAKQYKMFDGEALVVDAVLGALFPVGARVFNSVFKREPTTAEVDASITTELNHHQTIREPEIPLEMNKLDQHRENLAAAERAIFVEGKDPYSLQRTDMGETMINPEFAMAMRIADDAVNSHLKAEAGMDMSALSRFVDDSVRISGETSRQLSLFEQPRPIEGEARTVPEELDFARSEVKSIEQIAPDMKSPDATGEVRTLKEINQQIEAEARIAKEDAALMKLALSCALSYGT